MRRSVLLCRILAIFVVLWLSEFLYHPGDALPQTTTYPLIQQTHLVYLGAFRLPAGTFGSSSFAYGGTALAYNPTNNALFLVGHVWDQDVAEVRIPQILNSTQVTSLATAAVLQPFTDATEGKLNAINPSDSNSKKVGGTLVYSGQLYLAGYSYYDGAGTQSASHFVRPLNLSTLGQVQGPVRVGSQYPGFVSGYMTEIPVAWQAQFGGPALTGNCCLSIISVHSSGPAASVFNPRDVGAKNPVPATPVVGYPISHPLGDWGSQNPYFNGATQVTGLVFPTDTRSVLFLGRHGTGPFCYGPGTSDPALAGQPADGGVDRYCYDPNDGSKGTHAYPYIPQVWAYDATELVQVKNGQREQWSVKPYAVWRLNVPTAGASIGGAAYDAQTGRIFVSQGCVDTNCLPLIHVFAVEVAYLSSPTKLRVVP